MMPALTSEPSRYGLETQVKALQQGVDLSLERYDKGISIYYEELAPARVAPRHLRDRGFTRRAPVAPADERVPEGRPAHGEPDEARDPGCRR